MTAPEEIPTCPQCRPASKPQIPLVQGACPVCNYIAPYRSSASQVETAELCLRKWYLDKVEGIPRKSNAAAQYGTVAHEHLKQWFMAQTPPPMTPEGRTALAILRCLPPPQTTGIEAEKEITIEVGGVPFLGYIDFQMLDLETRTTLPVPFISDHKTTSDLKWAKTPEELATSVQPTLYAAAAFEAVPAAREVRLQWTYATRHKSPRVLPVKATLTREDIAPRMQQTAETAQVLKTYWEARPDWREVPYDAAGCEAFDGCPYKDTCNLSPIEKIGSIMTQQEKSNAFQQKLLAAKAAQKNGGTVPTTSGTVNPPEAPAEAATSPEPEPEKPPKKIRKPRKAKVAAAPVMTSATVGGVDVTEDVRAAAKITRAQSIDPAVQDAHVVANTPKQATFGVEPDDIIVPTSAPPIKMLTQQYAAGFRDGFALGREVK